MGAVEELERIVGRMREAWPEVKITVRGDCAFSREEIMGWCEANGVVYVLGFARNSRLLRMIEEQAAEAAAEHPPPGVQPAAALVLRRRLPPPRGAAAPRPVRHPAGSSPE